MRKWLWVLTLTALVCGVAALSGCAEKLAPPADAVQSLLELRFENSTEESSLATALAEDAAGRTDKKSPIPKWDTPVVKESTETSAVVVITWKPTSDYKDWPKTTTFMLQKVGGRWVVVDAAESGSKEGTATP